MTDKKELKMGAACLAILSAIYFLAAPFTHHAMIGAAIGCAIGAISLIIIAIKL